MSDCLALTTKVLSVVVAAFVGGSVFGQHAPLSSAAPTTSAQLPSVTTNPDGTGSLLFLQGSSHNVASIAALKALTVRPSFVVVEGYYAAGDGGGGQFYWVADSTATADDGLVITPMAGAAGRYFRLFPISAGRISAAWFGVKCDLSRDDTPLIQKAINAATGAVYTGGIVSLPVGFCSVSATVTITKGIILEGAGRGLASGTGNSGGTVLRTQHATNDVISITSNGAVTIRDLTIDSTPTRTAGAFIRVNGNADASILYNEQSLFSNLYLLGAHDGLVIDAGINWTLRDTSIVDYRRYGVLLASTLPGGNGDNDTGQSHIVNNVIWALNTKAVAQSGIHYRAGGDVRIKGNKIIGGAVSVSLGLTNGPTGTLIIEGNSLEECQVSCVRAEQTISRKEFGNLLINGNQLSILAPSTPQNEIAIIAAASQWLRNVTITNNVTNSARRTGSGGYMVNDGKGVVIANNVINNNGVSSGDVAITVGGNATDVLVANNIIISYPSGKYTLNSSTVLIDHTGLAFAELPTVADGSMVYVTDGTVNSAPLTGSSTGAMAKRVNGAWRGD